MLVNLNNLFFYLFSKWNNCIYIIIHVGYGFDVIIYSDQISNKQLSFPRVKNNKIPKCRKKMFPQ